MGFKLWQNLLLALGLLLSTLAQAMPEKVHAFITTMHQQHQYDDLLLIQQLKSQTANQAILAAISKPAEALPWYKYKKILLTETRIKDGVKFWRQHRNILEAIAKKYQIPIEIIVAIIGVETSYGQRQGKYSVLNSLYTLAFHYPSQLKRQRGDFFKKELVHFLLLGREQGWSIENIKGSYAGAMGMGQFIPSSYRSYAVDESADGKIDLFQSHRDAIASVANYFKRHGWQAKQPVVKAVNDRGDNNAHDTRQGLRKPKQTIGQMRAKGLVFNSSDAEPSTPAVLYAFELAEGQKHWLTFHNFYVITRYNHSPLYAMAVYLLSQEIKASYAV